MKGEAVVLGGGLSGIAAAYSLTRAGAQKVTVLERGSALGGLAGSFEEDGHFYPLGYHHILHRDRTLLFFLEQIGALADVRWRRVRMLFREGGELYDLGTPAGFLHFPMSAGDKIRFVALMARAFNKSDWSDWHGRTAAELVDRWASSGVRHAIFEKLTDLKFELPCAEVSAAWLGARLHFREGSAPLGYIPGANWTKVLCDGLADMLESVGATVRLGAAVCKLRTAGDRIVEAELDTGERVGADIFVSSVPTEVYTRLVPHEETAEISRIRYSALISVVCGTRQEVRPDFYWMNLASPRRTAAGIFLLTSLNPTIGRPGDRVVNFVTHLNSRSSPLFDATREELLDLYCADYHSVFGEELDPFWCQVSRVPMYSPVFRPGFRNPPVRSASWRNLYFAGNYRTFPSIVSTGTALRSGLEAGAAILGDHGRECDLSERASAFKLRSMPRG